MFIAFIVFKGIRNAVSPPLSNWLIKSVGESSSLLTMLYSLLEQACQIVRIEGLLHCLFAKHYVIWTFTS